MISNDHPFSYYYLHFTNDIESNFNNHETKKFIIMLTIISRSSGLDSAIIIVKATKASSDIFLVPSALNN